MPKGVRGFQKGNKLSTGRPPKTPDVVTALERFNRDYVMREISHMMTMTEAQFKQAKEQPHNTLLRKACFALMDRVLKSGDYQCLDFVFNRSIGKPVEEVQEHTLNLRMLPREQVIELGMKAIRQLEGKSDATQDEEDPA